MINNPILFHYNFTGSPAKPVILFLHGFLGTGADWHGVISTLSPYYYCLTIDLPGHGKTRITGDRKSFTFERCATLIINLLKHLGVDTCFLIGYSMGGRLALHLAISYPEIFHKVLLESASPGLKTVTERRNRWLHDSHLAQELENNSLLTFLNTWYEQPIFTSLTKHPAFSNLKKRRLDQDGKQLAFALRAMSTGKQKSLWNKLRKVKLPILLVTGELDFKFTEIMQEMCHLLQQAELQILEGCGHNVHFEDPDKFIELVRNFF